MTYTNKDWEKETAELDEQVRQASGMDLASPTNLIDCFNLINTQIPTLPFTLFNSGGKWYCIICSDRVEYWGEGHVPTFAICRAYLAWKAKQ